MRSVDQRRLADQPLQLRAAELFQDVALPEDRPVGLEAREVAVLGEHVQAIAVDGRRAARPRAPIAPHPRFNRPERLRPHFLAVRPIERDDDTVVAARTLKIDAVACHGHRSITRPEVVRRPDEARTAGGPLFQEPGLLRDARPIRPLPLRPVSGGMHSSRTEEYRYRESHALCHVVYPGVTLRLRRSSSVRTSTCGEQQFVAARVSVAGGGGAAYCFGGSVRR